MWVKNEDLLFNANNGTQFQLLRLWGGARIIQRLPSGHEIEVARGNEDAVAEQFEVLAEELEAIDLAEEAEVEEEPEPELEEEAEPAEAR